MDIETKIREVLASSDLDLKSSKSRQASTGISPRFMDQKITPDVLSLIAQCILKLPSELQDSFTVQTIWDLDFVDSQLQVEFTKPASKEKTARSEYDKVIGQPLKALSYAGVLADKKQGRRIIYSVAQRDILEYIASKPYNAFVFLEIYITAALERSGLLKNFEDFRDSAQSRADFDLLKKEFEGFVIDYSPINTLTEVRRIFPKVLNPLSVMWVMRGTAKGRISQSNFSYSDLLYNRPNFRDIAKDKRLTRTQAKVAQPVEAGNPTSDTSRAMTLVRKRHSPQSELRDSHSQAVATQVHHIFSQSEFPALRSVPENLILLTPTQHLAYAHPNNDTSRVDPDYQIDCLIAKIESIRRSLSDNDGFYAKEDFIMCINIGLNQDISLDTSLDSVALKLRAIQKLRNQ